MTPRYIQLTIPSLLYQTRRKKASVHKGWLGHIRHARIQKILSGESNFDNFFLVDEGREDSNTTINGPSSTRQRNAIKMAFDDPTLNAGSVDS